MNARNLLASMLAVALLGVGIAQAAPAVGTAKARGDYRPGALGTTRDPGYGSTYARRAPGYRSYNAPVAAVPRPMIAQAPAEGRRFSYAPSAAGTATTVPCPEASVVPQAGRRYSHAPEATVAPTPTVAAPRAYSGGSSFNRAPARSGSKPLWALPKTDPRKFNAR
ncbi:MAG TPA: hypothetical protein PJ982_07095 [Lacipirellulaceae bacterium]|nr:hypothetical protein [Lacipirellulaceae bacterium]